MRNSLENHLEGAVNSIRRAASDMNSVAHDETVPNPERAEARRIEDALRELGGRIDDLSCTIPEQQRMED